MKLDLAEVTPSWQTAPTMLTTKSQFKMVTTKTGKLFAVGGLYPGVGALTTIDRLDVSGPTDGAWETVANFPGDGMRG